MSRKIFAALVAICFLYVASPLILPITMGAVLSVLCYPWLMRMECKKIPAAVGSAFLTIGITVLLLLPTSFLLFVIAKAALQQLQIWKRPASGLNNGFTAGLMGVPSIHSFMIWISNRFPVTMNELGEALQDLTASIGIRLTEFVGGVLTHLPGMLMAISIIVLSVYFFLVDGRHLIRFIRSHSIFNSNQTELMIRSLAEMCRSVIIAAMVSGVSQALLESIVCVITGTAHAPLIGAMVFIGSFIPVVGSLPITLGVAVHQFALGNEKSGIVLGLAALMIGAADNLIRPIFLKGAANLHPLLAFVAAFGGLQTLGFLGVFLGPIVASLFIVTLKVLSQKEGNDPL